MAELKTVATTESVSDYLETVEPVRRREDSKELIEIFEDVTGEKAVLWSNHMIGFGCYHYKSDRSTQEGDWPLTGFAPRKQSLTIYIMPGAQNYPDLLERLGKFKSSKGSCIYINKLTDVDTVILKKLILNSFKDMQELYTI